MDNVLTVTANEASETFLELLDAVREGKRVTITSGGEAVAEIIPTAEDEDERRRFASAFAEMERHWATLKPIRIAPWSRDELYDRSLR